MSNKGYTAYSYAGGEEAGLTLAQARRQVEVWEEKGYNAYVGKDDDPTWEDTYSEGTGMFPGPSVSEAKELSPEFIFAAIGPDPEAIKRFAFALLQLNGQELGHQDDGTMVYDRWSEL